jgi:hypothetical protein
VSPAEATSQFQQALVKALDNALAEEKEAVDSKRYSLYLLYWYKSTVCIYTYIQQRKLKTARGTS